MEWINENKEWLFGGLISTILGVILTFWLMKSSSKSIQKQKGGKKSMNFQAGKNLKIK
jgi:uncharacterized Tic20 family protein